MNSETIIETPLEKAVRVAGGQTALARALSEKLGRNFRQGQVWKWLKSRDGRPPAEYARAIAQVTAEIGDAVGVHELRPDVFGDKPVCECEAA